MEDSTATFDRICNKVEGFLGLLEMKYTKGNTGYYYIDYGSTYAGIFIHQREGVYVVGIGAPVALEIKSFGSELAKYLCEENYNLIFGKFGLDEKGKAIWFTHSICAEHMKAEEFMISLAAVMTTANEYDDKVARMAGGKRATDPIQ